MKIYKYQATGNDFLIMDDRKDVIDLSDGQIIHLCDRRYGIGADGIIILKSSPSHDFRMAFYNNDASAGMMCGNGGRCIIAFAQELGIKPGGNDGRTYIFDTPVGVRHGVINGILPGNKKIVTLYMGNVSDINIIDSKYSMNTGTDHLVIFCDDTEKVDIISDGRKWRYDQRFSPNGTNVDFVQITGPDSFKIRTYEKGVENETYSCGTGVIAASIATRLKTLHDNAADISENENRLCSYNIRALRDNLKVHFLHHADNNLFENIEIQGETQLVFTTDLF